MQHPKVSVPSTKAAVDFNVSPFLVIWECTRACDLACVHCRTTASPEPEPNELDHDEALRLIENIAEMGVKILIFSGGARDSGHRGVAFLFHDL